MGQGGGGGGGEVGFGDSCLTIWPLIFRLSLPFSFIFFYFLIFIF